MSAINKTCVIEQKNKRHEGHEENPAEEESESSKRGQFLFTTESYFRCPWNIVAPRTAYTNLLEGRTKLEAWASEWVSALERTSSASSAVASGWLIICMIKNSRLCYLRWMVFQKVYDKVQLLKNQAWTSMATHWMRLSTHVLYSIWGWKFVWVDFYIGYSM